MDLIITHARVVAMDAANTVAEAVPIHDEKSVVGGQVMYQTDAVGLD
jgi:hypothetical protein